MKPNNETFRGSRARVCGRRGVGVKEKPQLQKKTTMQKEKKKEKENQQGGACDKRGPKI